MPYYDLRADESYNRCFADLRAQAYNTTYHSDTPDWNKFPDTTNGWSGDNIDSDIPRLHEYWRTALFNDNAMFINPGGYSFYYYALGGEFSETVSNKPYTN